MTIARRALLGAGLAAPALLRGRPARADGQVIVGTWGGDYAELLSANIDKPLMGPLGIEAVQDVATQDPRKAKLTAERASRRGTMDVACLSDVDMYTMSLLQAFAPVTATEVANLPHVFPQLRTPYAIPHIYSGLVVLYNPDKVKPAPASYSDLWDPKWKGRVGFADVIYLYNIAAAALSSGGSMTNFEPGKKQLMEVKGNIRIYPSNEALATALKGEEVWLAPMWLARGFMWRKGGVNVAHAVPEEGAVPYISAAGVPKNAPDKANAMAYLNAMLDPVAQVAFADRMGYVPTVDNAKIPDDLAKQIAFTDAQRERLQKPDYGYMAQNTAGLLDFWNKEFKA